MSAAKRAPTANRLLAALPPSDRKRVLEKCEPVELVFGAVLCEPGQRVRHVYFPIDSFVSLVATVDGRAAWKWGWSATRACSVCRWSSGCGFAAARGSPRRRPGAAREGRAFGSELEQSRPFREVFNRYLYALLAQFAQTAACTSFHVVDARLARWLLMTHDRAHSDGFHLTHEFLAHMLGVRRVGVTKAAACHARPKADQL